MSTGPRVLCLFFLLCVATAFAGPRLLAQDAPLATRNPIPRQSPGTVYLVNDGEAIITFSLSYNARNWSDYELRPHHACIVPVEELGHREVVIRFVEKPGSEVTNRLEANERYQFVYKTDLKRWEIRRLR